MPSLSSNGSQKNLRVEIIFPACLFLPAASPDPIPASLSITGAVKPSDSLPRFSPLQPPNPTFNPKTKKKKKETEKEGEKRRGREKKKKRKQGRKGEREGRKEGSYKQQEGDVYPGERADTLDIVFNRGPARVVPQGWLFEESMPFFWFLLRDTI